MTTRRPVTLLFLVTEDWYFVSHRLALARAAQCAGYRVVVVTRETDHGEQIRSAGMELLEIGWRRRGAGILSELKALVRLIRIYRKIRPDIVHHVALKAMAYGSLAAVLCPSTSVINAVAGFGHVFTSGDRRSRFLRPILLIVLRIVSPRSRTWVVVQNEHDLGRVISSRVVRAERAIVIRGSGVDLARFRRQPFAPGVPLVVLASRMLWAKGPGRFVEAASILAKSNVAARFALVGDTDDGNPSAVPREKLQEWNEKGIVEWWGHRDDMPDVLAQAHIVSLPTTYGEGIPKILLEAGASGRPIVATDIPGCRDVVRDGVNGILVPPQDTQALAAALKTLIDDEQLRVQFGSAGRTIVENDFSVDKVVSETLTLYRNILTNHRS